MSDAAMVSPSARSLVSGVVLILSLTLLVPMGAVAQAPSASAGDQGGWPSSDGLRRELQSIGYDFEFGRGEDASSSTWTLALGAKPRSNGSLDITIPTSAIILSAAGDDPASVLFVSDLGERQEAFETALLEATSRLPIDTELILDVLEVPLIDEDTDLGLIHPCRTFETVEAVIKTFSGRGSRVGDVLIGVIAPASGPPPQMSEIVDRACREIDRQIALATPKPTPTPPPTPSPTPTLVPAACSAASSPVGSEPSRAPADVEVVGFLTDWLIEDAAAAIDTDLLTLLAFHGIEASRDGRLVSRKPSGDIPRGWSVLEGNTFAELKDRLQAAGVKVVPTIQRFGWTEGTAERTEALLTKRKDRRSLATRIARFVERRGFDGVNLDFEPMPKALADEYVAFVREVRAALVEIDPELHLSVSVVASLSGYDLAGLVADDAADLAIIMGYNYRSDGALVAGSTAPLRDPQTGDLSTTVTEALAQVAPDKLVLALPWYGKAWSTESDEARSTTISGSGIDSASEPSYALAVELASQAGRRYQPDQASAWTVYPDRQCATCPAVWRQVWYDDPDSFGAKVDYALEQGLAGVGIWALGHEDGRDEMWWALRDRLRPRIDDSPPSGSAALDPEAVKGELEGRDVVEGSAPLRLFALDNVDGSGVVFARVSLVADVDGDCRLVTARTYPAADRIDFPLADESTGGSSDDGPRSIYVQWRDLMGNWSRPLVIETWAIDPVTSAAPADL